MTSGPTPTQRLADLGISLPPVVAPLAAYVPATHVGHLVYTSGQLPMVDGELMARGKVSENAEGVVDVETAVAAARQCALNGLAAIDSVAGIDRIIRVVKVTGYVASAPGFSNQATVLNGASHLLAEVFGDAGAHVRSAVGVAELPLGAPVEVELTVQIEV